MKRFCAKCNREVPEENMVPIKMGHMRTRLVCQSCASRSSTSWFGGVKKDDKKPS